MNMYLTEEQIFDLAFEKLNISNPNPDKIIEIAEMLDLEYDEEKGCYINPESKESIIANLKKISPKEINTDFVIKKWIKD